MSIRVYVGLGSNLDAPAEQLRSALDALDQVQGAGAGERGPHHEGALACLAELADHIEAAGPVQALGDGAAARLVPTTRPLDPDARTVCEVEVHVVAAGDLPND